MNKLNKKIFNRVLIGLFMMFVLSGSVYAINLEYKNSLSKVELSRISDDSYTINLYTSKKITDPVKVIKKNDLNYYILLPETKNSTGVLSSASSDIRSVTANSYNYAGQDVNNGYTKINITTTKPINFNVNVKNSSLNSISHNVAMAAKLPDTSLPVENQAQKKNSEDLSQNSKKVKQAQTPALPKAADNKTTKTKEALNNQASKKPVVKQLPKKEVAKKQDVQNIQKNVQNKTQPPKTQTKIQPKIAQAPEQKSEQKLEQKIEQKPEPKKQEATTKPVLESAIINKDINSDINNQIQQTNQEIQQEQVKEKPQISDEIINDFEALLHNDGNIEEDNQALLEDTNFKMPALAEIKSEIKHIFNKAKSIFDKIGISPLALLFMLITGIAVFFMVLYILTRKQKSSPILKRKSDLMEKVPPVKVVNKNDGKGEFFVFDNNVKQVVFSDPASSAIKRNYELSSYDPELKNYEKLKKSRINKEKQDSEYDIIQKILREDSFIDISQGEYDVMDNPSKVICPVKTETKAPEKLQPQAKSENEQKTIMTSPIVKEEMKIELQDEPVVLSKVEIAPEKGFMCVSYNDNISLVGYIFDDVFALYNFKCPKLENYDIKYRLSDKDEYGANFIVKVDKVRVLVGVANKSMKLQVVM